MRWRRKPDSSPNSAERHLAPIRIFTSDLELGGHLAPAGQRVTDMLLRGQDLVFLPDGAPEEPGSWISISPSEVLLVVPPPLPARPGWQEDRERREVTLEVGPYRVRGTMHLPPGVGSAFGLKGRQAFAPLTRASISVGPQGVEETFEVVIVHVARGFVWDETAAPAPSTW